MKPNSAITHMSNHLNSETCPGSTSPEWKAMSDVSRLTSRLATNVLFEIAENESREDIASDTSFMSTKSTVSLSSNSSHSSTMRITPTIEIDDEGGTEVLLDSFADASWSTITVTPRKDRSFARSMSALLDTEISPAIVVTNFESRESSPAVPTGCYHLAVSCFNGHGNASALGTDDLQNRISKSLASTENIDTWSNGWQAWSFFGKTADHSGSPADAESVRCNIQRVLRNRTFHHDKRKKKLSSLRRNLNPFGQNMSNSTPHSILKTRSFNLVNTPAVRPAKAVPQRTEPSLWHCGLSCALSQDESPFVLRTSSSMSEDDCYDSDPEDFVRRARPHTTFQKIDETHKENARPAKISFRKQHVKHQVQALMNERLTLILHDESSNRNTRSLPSRAVHVWIERGQYLQRGLLQPKLVWKFIGQPSMRPIAVQRSQISGIPLLDIHRVLTVPSIDRKLYPFAKIHNCFTVKALDRTLLFEANSALERDRIVESLKLCVSRLGSMLLAEDDGLVDEFFAGVDFGPGLEPYWLNQDEEGKAKLTL